MEEKKPNSLCKSCSSPTEKPRKCKICRYFFCGTCIVVKKRFLIRKKLYCVDCFNREKRKKSLPKSKDFFSEIQKKAAIKKSDPGEDYNVVKKIGQGSVGMVLEVEKKSDHSRHAMKVINLRQNFDRTRAVNEIGLMQITSHENIVKIIETYEIDE